MLRYCILVKGIYQYDDLNLAHIVDFKIMKY